MCVRFHIAWRLDEAGLERDVRPRHMHRRASIAHGRRMNRGIDFGVGHEILGLNVVIV